MKRSCLLFIVLLLNFHEAFASAKFNNENSALVLDEHMEFAVSDTISSDNLKWVKDDAILNRQPNQYLHFRVTLNNEFNQTIPVWFSVGFPAMKTLVFKANGEVWETGDAFPFKSREVHVSNYHFPLQLQPKETELIQGYMKGEILRYTFVVGSPEYFTNMYVDTLQRDMTFFGAMSLLTLLCFLGFFASRKIVFLSFATFIFATTFWFFRVFGYAFELLWPQAPWLNDISYAVSVYAVLISSFWVVFASLSRDGHQVFGATWAKWFCVALPFIGLLAWQTVSLDFALKLPVLLFFGFIVMAAIVITVEHKKGSDRAKWLAAAMLPVTLSTLILISIAVFQISIDLDPIATFMTGIVLTSLFIVSLTTSYMVKVVQRERDAQKVAAQDKARQAEKLEALVKERTLELEKTNKTLAKLASCDVLTGLPNRRSIDFFVDESFTANSDDAQQCTEDIVLFVALLDLDHFKSINDRYGHDVGDIVLKAVAHVLQDFNNDTRIAGRYGGEEFAVIERKRERKRERGNHEEASFAKTLSTIHKSINELAIAELPDQQVGVSIGWSSCTTSDDIVDAFRRADNALYAAKDRGRNVILDS